LAVRTELSAITAKFSGGEWQEALGRFLRDSQLAQDAAGRRLHDEVGQNLSALGLQLGVLILDYPDLAPEFVERVPEIQALLEKTIVQVREIGAHLNPSAADRAGLRYALEYLIEERRADVTELKLDFPRDLRVPRLASRALFRVAADSIDYVCSTATNKARIRIFEQGLSWVLEVLYNSLRPQDFERLEAGQRLTLLSLHYQAMRAGVRVVFDDLSGGVSVLRATYAAKDERL
jgi:glucose-6-phosphate-specific signal transduction histidine kinase